MYLTKATYYKSGSLLTSCKNLCDYTLKTYLATHWCHHNSFGSSELIIYESLYQRDSASIIKTLGALQDTSLKFFSTVNSLGKTKRYVALHNQTLSLGSLESKDELTKDTYFSIKYKEKWHKVFFLNSTDCSLLFSIEKYVQSDATKPILRIQKIESELNFFHDLA